MATKSTLTFIAYNMKSQNAINACQVDNATTVRGRRGKLFRAKPGDYIVQDPDGALRVVPKDVFETEWTAAPTPTAPSAITFSNQTTTALRVSWTPGDAGALTEVYKNNVLIATVAAGTSLLDVTSLTPNVGYAFKVRHVKNEVYSAFATPQTGYTNPVAPATPTLGSKTSTTIDIDFVPGDVTAQTQVYVDGVANGSPLAAGVTTKHITGLTTATPYAITLKHVGVASGQSSAATAALNVTTD